MNSKYLIKVLPIAYTNNPEFEMDNSVLWNNKATIGTNSIIKKANPDSIGIEQETNGFTFVKNKNKMDLNTENFKIKGQYLIMSQFPIPKNAKTYMEVEITSHPRINEIRHLGISLGLHKIPKKGILLDDFFLVNMYYKKPSFYTKKSTNYLFYSTTSRTNSNIYKQSTTGLSNYWMSEKINDKNSPLLPPPTVNKTIGIGIDTTLTEDNTSYTNRLTFYINGAEFFNYILPNELLPQTPDSETQDDGIIIQQNNSINSDKLTDLYFAMYSNLSNVEMEGLFNLGNDNLKYLPNDYISLYTYYNEVIFQPVSVVVNNTDSENKNLNFYDSTISCTVKLDDETSGFT